MYDTLGEKSGIILNEIKKAGEHSVTINSSSLSNGINFYRIETSKFIQIRKIVLAK